MHLWLASLTTVVHLMAGPAIVHDTTAIATIAQSAPRVGVEPDSVRAADDTTLARPVPSVTEGSIASAMHMDARLYADGDSMMDSLARAGGRDVAADTTSGSRRPRAIEYSDAYHTRLKIHQIGAYAMLPLFISEYIIGQKLLTSTNRSHSLKSAHSLIAGAVGIVFVSNTVTGVWNAWDSRKDPNGRARRNIHAALMLASDVGFVWTAMSASGAKRSLVDARRHRTIAISSIALSAVGSGMMWLWRN
ncbi:MAG: hypothetical protein JJD97_01200 [Gemmatimonadaceae bacterium]|nr:hypothetical protein [Gemmatimonadaceae bacterium]